MILWTIRIGRVIAAVSHDGRTVSIRRGTKILSLFK